MLPKIFYLIFWLWIVNVISLSNARVSFIPSFQLERCPEFKGNEANVIDTSEVDTHIENDTHVYFIGTVKFTTSLNTIPFRFYSEKYDRGQWIVQVFDRNYDDLCVTAHNPKEAHYPRLNSFPKCPIEAGTTWELNMIPFTLSEYLLNSIPPHYCGKWRGTFVGEFMVDGVKKYDCRRAYGDFFDDGKSKGFGKIVGG